MALWDRVTAMLAASPMAVEPDIQARSVDDFPDLQTQLDALQRQPRPWRPTSINEALGVPAIFRAVSLIANVVGSLSLEAFQLGQLITDRQQVPRLIIRPNPFTTPRVFFRDTAYYLASRGEAWWWVAMRDGDGNALSLVPVPPWEIVVAPNDKNRLRPTITWQGREMPNEDMRHITYLPDNMNLRGVGPLQLCGAAASVAVESQEWAANFFAGNIPSIVGETDRDYDELDLTALDAQWYEKNKSNLPRWIAGGIKLRDFGIDPAKAQMKDTREFQVGEVARMYGMPGPLLEFNAPGSSLTYQNTEGVWREFQQGCLSPNYLEPIEQEMSDLLTRATVARFSLAQLLRADIKTRFEVYGLGIEKGIITPEFAQMQEGIRPGNIDYAPVPLAPPQAIPDRLPPDRTRSAEALRCPGCRKLLAEVATPPYRMTCPRCKTVVADDSAPVQVRSEASASQPTINVHVTLPEGMVSSPVTVNPPTVNVTTPDVSVPVTVNPPTVNVAAPTVNVEAPNTVPHVRRYERDEDGLIKVQTITPLVEAS